MPFGSFAFSGVFGSVCFLGDVIITLLFYHKCRTYTHEPYIWNRFIVFTRIGSMKKVQLSKSIPNLQNATQAGF